MNISSIHPFIQTIYITSPFPLHTPIDQSKHQKIVNKNKTQDARGYYAQSPDGISLYTSLFGEYVVLGTRG